MESLDIKKHPSEKQIEADRAQVAEYLAAHPITRIVDGAWMRNGEVVKQAPPPKEFQRDDAVISPWNWRWGDGVFVLRLLGWHCASFVSSGK